MGLTQVKTSGIADDAVTLAKQAAGTDGNLLTYDASGAPAHVVTGTDGQVLTSNGAGAAPTFQTLAANTKSFRNLVVNGSCIIAQRSSSPVTDDSYRTVDRFALDYSGTDNHPTQAQHALTSSDTGPWEKGFRYSFHVTNGDQTSGAGTADEMNIDYRFEAQDIANSGWNYTSASSYITLSFWVKASVAQDYKFYLKTEDGTEKGYPMSTGALSANTWTKITKTIPGHADLTFDNNNGKGLSIEWFPFIGTDRTGSVTDNAWMNYSGSTRVNDMASTWWTTNDATFEITGVQLEVGDFASDFCHEPEQVTFTKCQRYFQYWYNGVRFPSTSSNNHAIYHFPTPMRAAPTVVRTGDQCGSYESGSTTALMVGNSQYKYYYSGLLSYGNSGDSGVGGYGTLSSEL